MGVIIRHIFRNIRKHWLSTLLIVISLALATSVVYLSLNISNDLIEVSNSLIESAYDGFDFIVYAKEDNYEFDKSAFQDLEIVLIARGTNEAKAADSLLKNHTALMLVKADRDLDDFKAFFSEKYPYLGLKEIDERINVKEQMDAIGLMLTILILVTALLCFFVIKSITGQLLDAREPVIATFRSLGASSRQTGLILTAENFIYGVLGGALGLPLAKLLRILIVRKYYSAPDAVLSVKPIFVLFAFLYSIALQLLIVSTSLVKISKISVRSSLITKPETEYEYSNRQTYIGVGLLLGATVLRVINGSFNGCINIVALLMIISGSTLLLPFFIRLVSSLISGRALKNNRGTLFLSSRNLITSKNNVASITLCCMVTALSILIAGCVHSIQTYFENYQKNYPFEVFIKGLDMDAGEYEFTETIPGVGKVIMEFWDYGYWKINGESEKICVVRQNSYSGIITMKDELKEDLLPGHAIIDKIFARKNKIKIGDTVNLTKEEDSSESSVIIDGFCDSGFFNASRMTLILSHDDYMNLVERSPALVGLDFEGEPTPATLLLVEMEILIRTGEKITITSSSSYIEQDLSNAISALTVLSILPFCATAMAIVGIISNQAMSFRTKKRQFMVFSSFGIARKKLMSIQLMEFVWIYLIGSLSGILIGLWMLRLFRDITYSAIAYIPIALDLKIVSLLVAAGFAAVVITSLPLVNKTRKLSFAEEIRYE